MDIGCDKMDGRSRHVKGSNFERDVAKKFTEWSGVKFNRTFASGAQGKENAGDTRITGDLFAPVGYSFPFSVECKNHNNFNIRNLFLGGSVIKLFLKQNISDARLSNRAPLLVSKVSREDTYCVLPYTAELEDLLRNKKLPYFRKYFSYLDERTHINNVFDMIVTNLNSLLLATPEQLDSWYKDIDWDYLNKDKQTPFSNTGGLLDSLIDNVKEELDKDE
ncbi:putative resolvase [Lactobacillus phage LpeD]|uniref:Putative resolvase n=1 Tax=Lactobacillus phage LpeD TaxID=2041210 RepID=A0A291I9I0_9CAUD|nr:RusA-like Holliday junction resolvase [Lactobacillus phage LpeD]ATG86350.1 putative resolvase [Lactobacillus phage LpeD]